MRPQALRIMSTTPRRSPARVGRLRKRPRLHLIDPVEFRALRRSAGLTRDAAAEMIGVSLRTVGHWETGQTRIPYAAFKLLRIYRHGEFLHPAWQGYALIRGKLVTPENHELHPGDLSWLSLLHRRAEFGDQARERARALDEALRQALASSPSVSPASAAVEPDPSPKGDLAPSGSGQRASTRSGRDGEKPQSVGVRKGSPFLTHEKRPAQTHKSSKPSRTAAAKRGLAVHA